MRRPIGDMFEYPQLRQLLERDEAGSVDNVAAPGAALASAR